MLAAEDPMLGRFFRLLLALLVSQILLLVLFLLVLGAVLSGREGGTQSVHRHSALSLQLSGELVEYPTLPVLPFVNEVPLSQTHVLECIERAGRDDKVDVVLLELDFPLLGWGMAWELRQALARFQETGKQVWARADLYDEVGLYLASGCDSVFLPPHGKVMLNGLAFGAMYYKGLFDKIGVRANVHRIGAYKSAAEPYSRSGMSGPARENAGWLLDALWTEFKTAVEHDRELGPGEIEAAIARGTLQPEEAVERRLVDGVRQRQDLLARFRDDDGTPRVISVESYRRLPGAGPRRGHTLAVVHARGFILGGRNGFHPAVGTILGEASVVRDLESASRDDEVEAIVLRLDSPGGDILASDAIGHAVGRARARKPIVVSMVDVAASGGYMIAYRANRIVALPTTITGSIGSITGKLALRGLYDKLGLTKDFVTRGSYPFLYSDYHEWSAPEESLVVRQHWQDYRRWIEDIADRRAMTPAEVDSLGRGRVWSGGQARERALVDELGDLHHAVEVARGLAGVRAGESVRLVHYPKETGLLDVLEERSAYFAGFAESWARAARLPRGTAWAVLDLGLAP
jgi:protease-4